MNFVITICAPYPVSEQERSLNASQHYAHYQAVGFIRLKEPQTMTHLAQRWEQQMCAVILAILLPQRLIRLQSVRRWLLVAAILLGWQPASALKLPTSFDSIRLPKPSVVQPSTITIRGIVLDKENHQPIAGTSILLKDTAFGVSTGYDGTFEFTIPTSQLKVKSLRLVISFIGYDKYQVKLKSEELGHIYNLQIFLKPTLFSDF